MLKKSLRMSFLKSTIMRISLIPLPIIVSYFLSETLSDALSGDISLVKKEIFIIGILVCIDSLLKTIIIANIQKEKVKLETNFVISFTRQLVLCPLGRFSKTNQGEIAENIKDDIPHIVKKYVDMYPLAISGLLMIMCYMILLFSRSMIVAISLFIISIFQIFPSFIIKKYFSLNYADCRDIEAKITNHILDAVNGFDTIKNYDLKTWWITKMTNYHQEYIHIGNKTDALTATQRSIYRFLDNFMKYGSFILLGFFFTSGLCTFDDVLVAIYLSTGLFSSVKAIAQSIPEYSMSRKAEERVSKRISSERIIPSVLNQSVDEIKLEDLYHEYGGKSVFRGAHVTFVADKNYLVAGENGAGKTTLLNVITNIETPVKGSFFLNHTTRFSSLEQKVSRMQFFLVPQKDILLDCTAMELFEMFDDVVGSEVVELAQHFGVSNNILNEIKIKNLSGGERKKVYLALGFSIHSQWLLLDEPFNNLDKIGKTILIDLISQRKGIILIDHGEEAKNYVDQVLVIKEGSINENNYHKKESV